MALWQRTTKFINDVFWATELRRIDDSGERVAERTIPVGGRIGWDDDLIVPEGWLRCDGAVHEQPRYRRLYNVIANLYGGTPGMTFAVPTAADQIIKW